MATYSEIENFSKRELVDFLNTIVTASRTDLLTMKKDELLHMAMVYGEPEETPATIADVNPKSDLRTSHSVR